MRRRWTEADVHFVRRNYGASPTAAIAAALRRSIWSILHVASQLGLHSPIIGNGRRWTEAEDQLVREHYVIGGADAVRAVLVAAGFPPRSAGSIYQRAFLLDLAAGHGTEEYAQIQRARHLGKRASPATEFRPGHVPWTKGLKGIHLSPMTEFRPGSRHGAAAQHYGPIGTVRIRRDHSGRRRRWIKVCEDGRESQRWIPLARFLWARDHGPIPSGHHVVHANGDTLDDAPQNLMLVTRSNQVHWQVRIRPEMEARRRARCAAASRRRWELWRRIRDAQQSRLAAGM